MLLFFNFRKEEKGGKSNQNFWPSNTHSKPQNFLVKGQNQFQNVNSSSFTNPSTVITTSSRDNNNIVMSHSDSSSSAVAPLSPFSRHHQLDYSRHPYAISLDRTKDSNGRETSRDPLREIRDNAKDLKRDSLTSREIKDGQRKSKKEGASWTKSKPLNEEVSLPNLLAGKRNFIFPFSSAFDMDSFLILVFTIGYFTVPRKSSSPKKALKVDAAAEDGIWSGEKAKFKKKDLTMPRLEGVEGGSASSVSVLFFRVTPH